MSTRTQYYCNICSASFAKYDDINVDLHRAYIKMYTSYAIAYNNSSKNKIWVEKYLLYDILSDDRMTVLKNHFPQLYESIEKFLILM